jgi:amino acid transporter
MDKWRSNRILSASKRFAKMNWGTPFIGLFIIFLMGAAICFSIGILWLADSIAVYAYYVLMVGLVLQLICFVKYRKSRDNNDTT